MLVLFTDFGLAGPYLGQITAKCVEHAPQIPVVNLLANVPAYNIRAGACLLSAFQRGLPSGCVFLAIVDPGVGDPVRSPVVLKTSRHWYVGPENGLFDTVAHSQGVEAYWRIVWRPAILSATFHGRDLFAPIASRLALGQAPDISWLHPQSYPKPLEDIAGDLYEVIYIDGYGNLITGIDASRILTGETILLNQHMVGYAATFSAVPKGQGFWYGNSSGLVEIAVNQGNAAQFYGAALGCPVAMLA